LPVKEHESCPNPIERIGLKSPIQGSQLASKSGQLNRRDP